MPPPPPLLPARSLWRILRVMHGVAEAMELKQEGKLQQHHRLVHGLQQVGGCREGGWVRRK